MNAVDTRKKADPRRVSLAQGVLKATTGAKRNPMAAIDIVSSVVEAKWGPMSGKHGAAREAAKSLAQREMRKQAARERAYQEAKQKHEAHRVQKKAEHKHRQSRLGL